MAKTEPEVGETIPAGRLVLLTSGSYSDYGVNGLYRTTVDVVIPGKQQRYGKPGELEADISRLSVQLEEVDYVEVWESH